MNERSIAAAVIMAKMVYVKGLTDHAFDLSRSHSKEEHGEDCGKCLAFTKLLNKCDIEYQDGAWVLAE